LFGVILGSRCSSEGVEEAEEPEVWAPGTTSRYLGGEIEKIHNQNQNITK